LGFLSERVVRRGRVSLRVRTGARLLAAGCLVAACHRGASGAPGSRASAPALVQSSVVLASAALSPLPAAGYAQLISAERWADAKLAIDALPDTARAEPALRFARARVAFETGDAAGALAGLAGLDPLLPLISGQIAELRARAQLVVGPFPDAARFYEARSDGESLLFAASAHEQAGAPQKALLALDRALVRVGKSKHVRSLEVRARAQRAEVLSHQGDKAALAEYRWLALNAPLRAESAAAVPALEQAGGAARLSKAERLTRATAFAEAGRTAETRTELSALEGAPGPSVAPGKISYLRAEAEYTARGDYVAASALFEQAAREDPENAPRALFFAARALSRAGQDPRAIAGYDRVMHQFPKSGWADQAQYLSARLRFSAGDFKKARALYDAYLAEAGSHGRYASDANYERALCALETDQPALAALAFARLSARTSDARAKVRLDYLSALAQSVGPEKTKAIATFTRLARDEPLSFFGLAARARLEQLKAPVPPLLAEPAPSTQSELSIRLPADVALLAGIGLARDAEAALHSQESALRRAYAPRGEEALCNAYGLLNVAQRRYRLAQDIVRADALDKAPNAATNWAWRCIYPTPYESLVESAAVQEKLEPALVFAVMRQESAFDPAANSPAGAFGLLQLIEPTARRIADSLHEPYSSVGLLTPDHNVRYGARYLSKLDGHFGGNRALIAAAYNAGPEAVFRWLSAPEKFGLDTFVARIPFEQTRTYVERVLGNLARYQYLAGGASAVRPLTLDMPQVADRPDDLY